MPFFLPDLSHPSYFTAVGEQLRQGNVGPGDANEAFAEAIREYTKAKYVVLTTSGTVALMLAFHLLCGRERHTVGLPAYGEVATANAIQSLGHRVYPLDIGQTTGCLDSSHALGSISAGKINALCFVNFSGNTPGSIIRNLVQACEADEIPFVEDAACGLGHWSKGVHAGTFGRLGILSFSPHKLVTTGQGGAILCRDGDDYARIKTAINQGDKGKTAGFNYRMSDLNAALGLAQMRRLDEIIRQREGQWRALTTHYLENTNQSDYLWTPESGTPIHNITFEFDAQGVQNYKVLSDHSNFRNLEKLVAQCPTALWWALRARYLPFGLGQP